VKIKNLILPIIFVLFINFLIFFKFFTSGLYPIPGDLLVSFYFPWYSGGWEDFVPGGIDINNAAVGQAIDIDNFNNIYIGGNIKRGDIYSDFLITKYTRSGRASS